jgi:hypothetical protein
MLLNLSINLSVEADFVGVSMQINLLLTSAKVRLRHMSNWSWGNNVMAGSSIVVEFRPDYIRQLHI